MPRLVLFAASENLIISNENKLSMISLLENLTIGLPANQPIPPNANIPMNWFALTVWERLITDENAEFESYVEAGHIRSAAAKFKMTTPLHRIAAQILGFPVIFGELRLKAHLRQVGTEQWTCVGEYPLNIQRLPEVVHQGGAN